MRKNVKDVIIFISLILIIIGFTGYFMSEISKRIIFIIIQ